jgi:hypothetical protein
LACEVWDLLKGNLLETGTSGFKEKNIRRIVVPELVIRKSTRQLE